MHTLQVQVGLCLPFPLGGWMHTIQVHPGRCLGCFVVIPADDSEGPRRLSPKTATLARASKPEGSRSCGGLLLSAIFGFLKSGKNPWQPERLRNYYTNNQGHKENTNS